MTIAGLRTAILILTGFYLAGPLLIASELLKPVFSIPLFSSSQRGSGRWQWQLRLARSLFVKAEMLSQMVDAARSLSNRAPRSLFGTLFRLGLSLGNRWLRLLSRRLHQA